MRFPLTRRSLSILVAAVATVALGVASAHAFVPSCEDELAQAYPAELKADLSACDSPDLEIAGEPGIEPAALATALTGTWTLRSRTAHGITVSDESRTAMLYFDLGRREGDRWAGSALLLDRPQGTGALPASDAVAGFWGLEVRRHGGDRLMLSMAGDTVGSYAHVNVKDREGFEFAQLRGAFVSRPEAKTGASWDRVVVMDDSLTFVSCRAGLVERYVRTGAGAPRVEGASLEQYWQRLRAEGRVAMLGWPSLGAALGR